ncbi:GNAT family N-acetyltransferase [Mesorhizobium retamae]|uniref:GNAT family N-acetyltransferase n=1 Tax=Mesorhizobium retamae TaxID=2912854 RepID=A0ABS9Q8E1_9HYPH|nr:GNAT family N-acetyltransferase [Mesorhizobium sp. IRAMC:0171]MCG7503678.1 GNAT family N-acetyltransferase [Mesorhizobium sp. IRAMC:0171]
MVTLTVSTDVDEDIADLIGEGLDEYNIAKGGPYDEEEVWILARDDDGSVLGGLKGHIEYSWMFVDWLWVSTENRKGGLGSQLLGKAEVIAREHGCLGAYLETFSFQAPEFYKRHGFEEFGRIDDYPPGHATIWLKKRF